MRMQNYPKPSIGSIPLAGDNFAGRGKTGVVPAVNLEDGLKRTIAYFETIVRS